MKFKSYLLFFILFGLVPEVFIAIWWNAAVCLPTVIALYFLIKIRLHKDYTESLRAFSYLIFIFEVPKLIFALFYGINHILALALGVATCLFFSTLILYVTTHLKLHETTLRFKDLPKAFDGLRICQLADFHLGSFGRHNPYIKRIMDMVTAQKPDLILFCGDLVNFDEAEAEPYIPQLQRLKAPLGIFAVRGNHDYLLHGCHDEAERQKQTQKLIETERSLGWKVLLNESNSLQKEGSTIAIAGVENISTNPYFPHTEGDLKKALSNILEGTFTILLSHDPTHWKAEVAKHTKVNLTLSGHTHGLKYKLAGPHPSSWKFHHSKGIYTEGDQTLHVTAGLGSAFAFRLGGYPIVDILTLKTA